MSFLSNIESSHMLAGHLWASEPKLGDLQFFSMLYVLFIGLFLYLPDFCLLPVVYGLEGASQRAGMHLYIIDRSEQWVNGRKGGDEAGTATHYIIQAKLCLSSFMVANIIFFDTTNTFCILSSIRSFDRVVNL